MKREMNNEGENARALEKVEESRLFIYNLYV